MVLSWQEFETRSTSSRREGIAVINIVAAHFHVLLSSLIINSKPRARGQKDASTRAWNPLRRSEKYAIPRVSCVHPPLRFRVAMLMRERRRPRPSLGRASTESRYDLEFAGKMRNEYLYVVLQATLTRNGKRYRVKRLIDVVTRQFSNIILIRLSEHV